MRKYGFIKHSLVDYPGEVCSVVFLPGCNFKCPYCHNKLLAQEIKQEGWSLKEIMDYLEGARAIVTAVCITGGEPTLYPETLFFLVNVFKKMGLKVKVDSNGSSPACLSKLDTEVDYLAMDLKTSIPRYAELLERNEDMGEKIETSMSILMNRLPDSFEFRTTLDPRFVDEAVIHDLGKRLKTDTRWYLQRCRLEKRMTAEAYTAETEVIERLRALAKKYTRYVFLRE